MYLEIVTPDDKVYAGNVNIVQVPGTNGSFEILKHHAPIISSLDAGKVRILDENNKEQIFNISKGVIEVNRNKIILLAEKSK